MTDYTSTGWISDHSLHRPGEHTEEAVDIVVTDRYAVIDQPCLLCHLPERVLAQVLGNRGYPEFEFEPLHLISNNPHITEGFVAARPDWFLGDVNETQDIIEALGLIRTEHHDSGTWVVGEVTDRFWGWSKEARRNSRSS